MDKITIRVEKTFDSVDDMFYFIKQLIHSDKCFLDSYSYCSSLYSDKVVKADATIVVFPENFAEIALLLQVALQ